jgi:two-component system, NtrC family, response regulator AtoC
MRYHLTMEPGAPPADTTTIQVVSDEPTDGALCVLVVGAGSALTFPLPSHGEVLIGRAEEADLRICEPWISRRHGRLLVEPTLRYQDLGGANGSRVRGRRLASNETVALRIGDVVELSQTQLMVQHHVRRRAPPHIWLHGYFEPRLEQECARAAAFGLALSLARISLRKPVADAALVDLLGPHLGQEDLAAWYGEDELELLMVRRDADAARAAVEAIRAALSRQGVKTAAGLATFPTDGRGAGALMSAACTRLHGGDETGPALLSTEEPMASVCALVTRVAASDAPVLLLGESGAGKEVIAQALHARSSRAAGPLVRLNCAAFSESLLESELFGHERGAFTGAHAAKPGLLETANGGSVFLDEIGEMSPALQAKLLRVLEERQVLRVGGLRSRPLDVRFIAATNRDLAAEVRTGGFRKDLYYRLSGLVVEIPPLRERRAEIEPLARLFIAQACARAEKRREPSLSDGALEMLRTYDWPGNVRELRNVMERIVLLCDADRIERRHLPLDKLLPAAIAASEEPGDPPGDLRAELQRVERSHIVRALEACNGNQSQAARMLGIARNTLLARIREYGLQSIGK